MTTSTPEFVVQYQPLSQTIEAGQLNAARDLFVKKNDQTGNVLHAVAQFVESHELGPEMTFEIDNYILDISVTKRK